MRLLLEHPENYRSAFTRYETMVTIGASVAGAAVSVGGSALLSSMSSGSNSSAASGLTQSTDANNQKLLRAVKKVAENLQSQVQALGNTYTASMSAEEANAVARLGAANQTLSAQLTGATTNFASDIQSAINDLTSASETLNIQNRSDVLSELKSFKQQAAALDTQARSESAAALDKNDAGTKSAIQDYAGRSESLGDKFLAAATAAQSDYQNTMATATSTDPTRLAKFTDAADFLSKRAQQTRLDLIQNADPRAFELSAIADENAAAMMQGRISADTQANLARTGAMKALAGGFGGGSAMGRNLTARDLGLTAMDLQQQGTANYAQQRAANYDQRIAGTQVDAVPIMTENNRLLSGSASDLLKTGIGVAESDRNQRLGATKDVFTTRLGAVNTRFGEETGLSRALYSSNLGIAGKATDASLGNLNSIYTNRLNTIGTVFNTNTARSEKIYNAGLDASRQMYTGNLNVADSIYRGNTAAASNIFSSNQNSANLAATLRSDAFGKAAGYSNGAAGTQAAASMQDSNNQTALWGSAVDSVSAIAGNAFGQLYKTPSSNTTGSSYWADQSAGGWD
jgi:hypothetical protein